MSNSSNHNRVLPPDQPATPDSPSGAQRPVTIFTQGFAATLIPPQLVTPIGLVAVCARGGDYQGKIGAVRAVTAAIRKEYPDVDLVVNASFDFYGDAHPGYNCYGVNLIGDGYRLKASGPPASEK